jgi:hypothetical protein
MVSELMTREVCSFWCNMPNLGGWVCDNMVSKQENFKWHFRVGGWGCDINGVGWKVIKS